MRYSMKSPGVASTTLIVVSANTLCSLDETIHVPFNNTTKNSAKHITDEEAEYVLISK